MTMSVEGVIHADIPAEGKFSMALYRIRHWLEYQRWINVGVDEINSLCSSFEALLELANGFGYIETYDNAATQEQIAFEHGRAQERAKILTELSSEMQRPGDAILDLVEHKLKVASSSALAEVQRIVEEMQKEHAPMGPPTWKTDTLKELLRRISEPEAIK